jgi:hypothetical protein
MNTYDLIDKKWILSPTARRVYRTSAAVSLTLYVSLFSAMAKGPTPFWKQALFLGVLGTAITGTGMEVFLFRYDDSGALKQILWFVVMLFFPLGPALYCYLVYSRSKALKADSTPEEALEMSKPIG